MRAIIRIIVVTAAAAAAISGCGSAGSTSPGGQTSAAATSGSAASPASSSASASALDVSLPAGYEPLYPFASPAEVRAWQASYASGGHQPWHLSASQTALAFATGYLGFQHLNQVAKQTVTGEDARVSVGLALPNGKLSTAAVVHLVRFGTGPQAPWEVVGTDDTTFSLTRPGYGAAVASPLTVGGKITGVDESIRTDVHQLASATAVGTHCCTAAGGQASPWSDTVTFHAASGQVITIVVSTGGHVSDVERFSVTGAQVR
jgi:hypothetical protein